MSKPVVQDAIQYVLVAESTVVNDSVKLVASISGMIPSGTTQDAMILDIRSMMQKLVPDAQWMFAGINRTQDVSGMERIDLQASARVSENENYGLDKRARDVSKEGMTVTSIYADTTPPADMVEKCEQELRVTLLKKAQVEMHDINKVMQSSYRISDVTFNPASQDMSNSRMSSKTPYGSGVVAMATMAMSADAAGGSAPQTLGNAVKLVMRATVTLRKMVKIAD